MTAPFVRPDTKAFLAFLNTLPGPKMEEMDAAGAAHNIWR